MRCPAWGTDNLAEQKFCCECGTTLAVASAA
jgi:hypothetical protein